MDKKKFDFDRINIIFLVLFCIAFCYWTITLGVLAAFILPFIFFNILLAIFYNIYRKKDRFRSVVVTLRCIIILIAVVLSISPQIVMRFENDKAMYPAKRIVYMSGVKMRAVDVLPSSIPNTVYDYTFFTSTSLHGPDYTPWSFLSFKCDDETAKKFLKYYIEKNGATKREKEQTFKEYFREKHSDEKLLEHKESVSTLISRYLDVPSLPSYRLFSSMSAEEIIQLAENAEVYEVDGYSCLIYDKKNNIFAFWV